MPKTLVLGTGNRKSGAGKGQKPGCQYREIQEQLVLLLHVCADERPFVYD